MSTVKRLLSGSAAGWSRIGVTVLTQVILVPIYLRYWSVDIFGIWLSIQAVFYIISLIEFSFQTFWEFEFLRLAKLDFKRYSVSITTSAYFGLILSCTQLLIIILLSHSNLFQDVIGLRNSTSKITGEARGLLFVMGLGWLINSSVAGIMGRSLSAFGYFPRVAWWNVGAAMLFALGSIIAVINGGGLLIAGIVGTSCTTVYTAIFYFHLNDLMSKCGIRWTKPDVTAIRKSMMPSFHILIKSLLENFRNQGIRLLLVPLAGLQGVVQFATTRTPAGFALQGINTITSPLMPELMRFLHHREQDKFEASLGFIWIVVIIFLCPLLLIIQLFIAPIFKLWTHNKIELDPLLFALMSITVLIYAWSQPFTAILRGNNLIRRQLFITLVSAILTVSALYALVPHIGLTGAGYALCLGEASSAILAYYLSHLWLKNAKLKSPDHPGRISLIAIILTATAIVIIAEYPQVAKLTCALSVIGLLIISYYYITTLPKHSLDKIKLNGTRMISKMRRQTETGAIK